MARLKGDFYQGQVDYAVREYQRKYPPEFHTNIEGFAKWLKENSGPR